MKMLKLRFINEAGQKFKKVWDLNIINDGFAHRCTRAILWGHARHKIICRQKEFKNEVCIIFDHTGYFPEPIIYIVHMFIHYFLNSIELKT
jgi:hypothetical protein